MCESNCLESSDLAKSKHSSLVRVANSLSIADANVAIQLSGTFGSRQEEAQRLGRILRPKFKRQKSGLKSNQPIENKLSTLW